MKFKPGDIVRYKKCKHNNWYNEKHRFKVVRKGNGSFPTYDLECLQDIFRSRNDIWHHKGKIITHIEEGFLFLEPRKKDHLPEWL
jgi:hypothetical protein